MVWKQHVRFRLRAARNSCLYDPSLLKLLTSFMAGTEQLSWPAGSRRLHWLAVRQTGRIRDACSHLQALLSNPSYRQRATEIATRLDAENGAMTSCDRIEEVLRRDSQTIRQTA